jgi:hypothetical protein
MSRRVAKIESVQMVGEISELLHLIANQNVKASKSIINSGDLKCLPKF